MNKDEFLKKLTEALIESVDRSIVNEQIDYYDKYIDDEIKKGRTEQDVLSELGDPRLIAKTIKTVNKIDSLENIDSSNNDYTSNHQDERYRENNSYYSESHRNSKSYTSNTQIIGCAIAFLVFFIIVMGIFRLFGDVAYGLGALAFSGPIGFIIVISLLYFIFGRGRR